MNRFQNWLMGGWLLLTPALLFVPVWFSGNVFGTFDLGHMTIALEDLFARYQSGGQIPVWAPEFHGGFPLMANAFQDFFYLPHVVLRAFLPGVWAVNFSLLLHLWLAGVGMYLWLSLYRLPKIAAAFGGLIFAMGGYFVGRITLTHLFFPATWIPLVMWTAVLAWREPSWKRVMWASLAAAGLVFAGHIQIAVYTGITGVVVLLGELTVTAWRNWAPRWRLLVIPVLLIGLTAVHIFPAVELVGESRRAEELKDDEAFDVSYPAQHLLTWLRPSIFGHQADYRGAKNEPELMLYFGLVGLSLGLVGLGSIGTWRSSLGRSAVILIAVGFALAGGEYSPIFLWLREHVWIIGRLANPGRAIMLVHVGWSLLAALGAAAIFTRWRWRYLHHAGFGLLAVVAIELLFAARPVNPVQPVAVWRVPRVAAYLPARTDAPRMLSHKILEPVPQTDFNPEVGPHVWQEVTLQQDVVPQRGAWEAVDVELTWNGRESQEGEIEMRIEEAGREIRSVRLKGKEIVAQGPTRMRFTPIEESKGRTYLLILSSTYERSAAPQAIIRTNRGDDNFNSTGYLRECRGGICRALSSPEWTAEADLSFFLRYRDEPVWLERELLLPLFGESVGQQMMRTHISLQIDRVDQYLFELGARAEFDGSRLILARDLLDRFSVGTIMAAFREGRELKGLPNVIKVADVPAGDVSVHIYRNEQAYPRFQLAQEVVFVNDPEEARRSILRGIAREAVTLEAPAESLPGGLGQKMGDIHVVKDSARDQIIQVTGEEAQLLVVRDVLHQGWQAYVDEKSVPLYYVDSLFRGVVVPPGQRVVQLRYRPQGWRTGALISGITWVGALGSLYFTSVRRVSKPYRTESENEAEEDSRV